MTASARGVVLFHSMHAAFELERALSGTGIAISLIPTPRELSSDCGTALRFPLQEQARIEATIAHAGINIAGIHAIEG
jgi:hypothetical protein